MDPSDISTPIDPSIDEPINQELIHIIKSDADYDNQLKNAGSKLVLIEYCATWNEPCKYFAPYLETFARKYASQMVVLKVDIDEQNRMAKQYKLHFLHSHSFKMPLINFERNNVSYAQVKGTDPSKVKSTIRNLMR